MTKKTLFISAFIFIGLIEINLFAANNSLSNEKLKNDEGEKTTMKTPEPKAVFKSGEGDYHTYRIPSILVTSKGTVLTFCEGRKKNSGDSGNIDMIMKRSVDGGITWSDQQVIWDDESNTCGNPCVVQDETTGRIWLLMTWNLGEDHEGEIINLKSKDTRRVYHCFSDDEGVTWSTPKEITSTTKKPEWSWYATGSGAGIQIKSGPHKGRLVIPCDHIEKESKHYYSHIIYSDDNGKNWLLGGRTTQHKVNECEVVELNDGMLMLNMRNYDRNSRTRQITFSDDGGISWRDQQYDSALIEPICQASIRRMARGAEEHKGHILFSNPASQKGRVNMTLRLSEDNATSWKYKKVLHEGPSAYSCLAVLPNGIILCFFEGGIKSPYENIFISTVEKSWLRQ